MDENQQLDEEQFGSSRVANEHDGDGDGTTEEDEERDDDGTTEEDEERDGYETAEDEGSCGGEDNEDERDITRVEDSDNEMQELDPPDKSKADSDEADSDDSGSDDFGSGTDSAFAVSNDVTIAGATVSQFCKPRTRCYFKLVGDNIDKNVKPMQVYAIRQTNQVSTLLPCICCC